MDVVFHANKASKLKARIAEDALVEKFETTRFKVESGSPELYKEEDGAWKLWDPEELAWIWVSDLPAIVGCGLAGKRGLPLLR